MKHKDSYSDSLIVLYECPKSCLGDGLLDVFGECVHCVVAQSHQELMQKNTFIQAVLTPQINLTWTDIHTIICSESRLCPVLSFIFKQEEETWCLALWGKTLPRVPDQHHCIIHVICYHTSPCANSNCLLINHTGTASSGTQNSKLLLIPVFLVYSIPCSTQ